MASERVILSEKSGVGGGKRAGGEVGIKALFIVPSPDFVMPIELPENSSCGAAGRQKKRGAVD